MAVRNEERGREGENGERKRERGNGNERRERENQDDYPKNHTPVSHAHSTLTPLSLTFTYLPLLERGNTGNEKQGRERESRKESDEAAGRERRYDGRADAIDNYEGAFS